MNILIALKVSTFPPCHAHFLPFLVPLPRSSFSCYHYLLIGIFRALCQWNNVIFVRLLSRKHICFAFHSRSCVLVHSFLLSLGLFCCMHVTQYIYSSIHLMTCLSFSQVLSVTKAPWTFVFVLNIYFHFFWEDSEVTFVDNIVQVSCVFGTCSISQQRDMEISEYHCGAIFVYVFSLPWGFIK